MLSIWFHEKIELIKLDMILFKNFSEMSENRLNGLYFSIYMYIFYNSFHEQLQVQQGPTCFKLIWICWRHEALLNWHLDWYVILSEPQTTWYSFELKLSVLRVQLSQIHWAMFPFWTQTAPWKHCIAWQDPLRGFENVSGGKRREKEKYSDHGKKRSPAF